jgi:hypothetical protein
MGIYKVESMPWYDTHEQCYYNTITINGKPQGALAPYVVRKNKPKLSPFDTWTNNCCSENKCPYVIYKSQNEQRPICEDEYDWLLGFLVENGYTIDYDMTKMIMKRDGSCANKRTRLLCFFKD